MIIHGVEPVEFGNFRYFINFQLKIEKNNGFQAMNGTAPI